MPDEGVNERREEANRAVAEEGVAAADVVAEKLIGVLGGMVGRMNDDLRMIVQIGSAVSADHGAAAVAVGGSLFASGAVRDDAEPGLIAQAGAVLADKNGVGQTIDYLRDLDIGVTIKDAVDACVARAGNGFRNVEVH